MPEMSAVLAWLVASPPYRVFAGRVVLPWALQGLVPAGRGLEIGAGSGAMAAELLTRFPGLELMVTDYDPRFVGMSRRALAPFGERATAQRADAADLPFADESFDLVLSFGMLHHVGPWQKAVSEAVRVLRPGGRLAGYDVLDTLPSRWAHQVVEPGLAAMLRPGQLEAELARLPVTGITASQLPGGLAVRFLATKKPAAG